MFMFSVFYLFGQNITSSFNVEVEVFDEITELLLDRCDL